MAETKKGYAVMINGEEFKGLSEDNLEIGNDFIEMNCEIKTTFGDIEFKARFTNEQWNKYMKICLMARDKEE